MTLLDPYDAAAKLLTAVAAEWEAAGGKKLPANRYVAEGASAPADGEQLAVTVGTIVPGLPGRTMTGSQSRGAYPMSVDLTAELWRERGAGLESSGGRQTALPTTARNKSAGSAAGSDLKAMLAVLLQIRVNGAVVRSAEMIAIRGVQPIGPQGDLVGVAGTVVVLLGR